MGNATLGNVYEGGVKCDNSLISNSYTGWIDLLGWGTGNNPTQTSTNASDYTTFTDWGTSAAGQIGDGWHTMSRAEWTYVYQSRSSATAKRARATV